MQGCDILKLQPYLRFLVQIRKRLEGSGLNRELTRLARCRQVLKWRNQIGTTSLWFCLLFPSPDSDYRLSPVSGLRNDRERDPCQSHGCSSTQLFLFAHYRDIIAGGSPRNALSAVVSAPTQAESTAEQELALLEGRPTRVLGVKGSKSPVAQSILRIFKLTYLRFPAFQDFQF